MSTLFGLDNDTWSALSAIGSLISGFGTLIAVWVSLSLARSGATPKLRVASGTMLPLPPMHPDMTGEMILVSGTNLGAVPITITGTYLRLGFRSSSKTVGLFAPNGKLQSASFPVEVTYGQRAEFVQKLDSYYAGLRALAVPLREKWFWRARIYFLRVGIETSTGTFEAPAAKRLKQLMLDACLKKPFRQEELPAIVHIPDKELK